MPQNNILFHEMQGSRSKSTQINNHSRVRSTISTQASLSACQSAYDTSHQQQSTIREYEDNRMNDFTFLKQELKYDVEF